MEMAMADPSEVEVEAIKKVVRRWARAFSSLDAETILSLWDPTYSKIMHQAEEFPDPIRGFDELSHYNRTMMTLASNLRDQSLIDLDADVIGDLGWCYLRGTITFDIPGMKESLRGQARQTFILRKTPAGWKIIHYHESRETPGLRE